MYSIALSEDRKTGYAHDWTVHESWWDYGVSGWLLALLLIAFLHFLYPCTCNIGFWMDRRYLLTIDVY